MEDHQIVDVNYWAAFKCKSAAFDCQFSVEVGELGGIGFDGVFGFIEVFDAADDGFGDVAPAVKGEVHRV